MRFRIVQRGDEPVVFGDVVGHAADVFLQLGDDFAACIADDHAVSGRPGIAARTAVNVGTVRGSGGLWGPGGFPHQNISPRRWRGGRPHEIVLTAEVGIWAPTEETCTD